MPNPFDIDGENGNAGEAIGAIIQLLPEPVVLIVRWSLIGFLLVVAAFFAFFFLLFLVDIAKDAYRWALSRFA